MQSENQEEDLLCTIKMAYQCPTSKTSHFQTLKHGKAPNGLVDHAQALKKLDHVSPKQHDASCHPSSRFCKVTNWRMCPIGTLPGPVEGIGVVPKVWQLGRSPSAAERVVHCDGQINGNKFE
jgi:hypothetical protein